jgi:hypothetical protein
MRSERVEESSSELISWHGRRGDSAEAAMRERPEKLAEIIG